MPAPGEAEAYAVVAFREQGVWHVRTLAVVSDEAVGVDDAAGADDADGRVPGGGASGSAAEAATATPPVRSGP